MITGALLLCATGAIFFLFSLVAYRKARIAQKRADAAREAWKHTESLIDTYEKLKIEVENVEKELEDLQSKVKSTKEEKQFQVKQNAHVCSVAGNTKISAVCNIARSSMKNVFDRKGQICIRLTSFYGHNTILLGWVTLDKLNHYAKEQGEAQIGDFLLFTNSSDRLSIVTVRIDTAIPSEE